MTSRERMLATFEFSSPDRLPVVYHPSEAGLHVHGERLRDLFLRYPPDNPIDFIEIPRPPEGTVSQNGEYYQEVTDEWGTRWGHHIFGIQGQPVAYPLASWSEAKHYAFPPLPPVGSEESSETHLVPAETRQTYLIIDGWVSIFQRLYALRPMADVLMDLATGDRDLIAFLNRLARYCSDCIDFLLAKGTDVVMFGDDWASQTGPLVSPDVFRDIFSSHYREMFARVHAAGGRVFFHCCGKMDYLLDDLIELGIDGLWHQSALYDSDDFAARCRDAGLTVYLHPDRQHLVPRGTPDQIRAAVRRFAHRYHGLGGGAIFYVEIENDAPFENARALIEAIDRCR
jgi:uroporphyrinogen decarboxylase